MTNTPDVELRRVQNVYNRVAARYDLLIAPIERLITGDGREWAIAQARGQVLEIGTGTGRTLAGLPAMPPPIGLDVSFAMLGEAARRTSASGAVLIAADAAHLPLADGSVDIVISTLTLCAMPNPAATLAEARRVLRASGALVLLEHSTSDNSLVAAGQRLLEKWTAPHYGEHLTRDIESMVSQAGFTLDQVTRRRGGLIRRVLASPR